MTIDITPKGSASNSYVTISEADDYFSTKFWFKAKWSAITGPDKEAWLIESTRAIDRFSFLGVKKDPIQSLEFPRNVEGDSTRSNNEIPNRVKQAQCEMIAFLITSQDAATGQIDKNFVQSLSIPGVISIVHTENKSAGTINSVTGANMETVETLLKPWLSAKNTFSFNVGV